MLEELACCTEFTAIAKKHQTNRMDARRQLPKVDTLMQLPELQEFPIGVRKLAARRAVSRLLAEIQEAKVASDPTLLAVHLARKLLRGKAWKAINMSGVILHTGLGRAQLADHAVDQLMSTARGHALIELDSESGTRGDRQDSLRSLLTELTGAEDAHVVNNCASAVLLTLSAVASGAKVVLSRGQMVEIGGQFRMPDVIRAAGCELVEVGCTNRTHGFDYANACVEDTAAILRCHRSNFSMSGFVSETELSELASISRQKGTHLIDDQGTGCLIDTTQFGLPYIPTVQDSIAAGADIVLASGDKLMGGPQAGLILGSRVLIERIRAHPVARAVRIDKLTLVALEATLWLYATGRQLEIPTLAALARSLVDVKSDAETIAIQWQGAVIELGETEIGGGAAPNITVPTFRVGLPSESAQSLSKSLRMGDPAVVGRIESNLVWLDPRTLRGDEMDPLLIRLNEVAS